MNCLIHFFQELDWKDFIYLELNSLLELNNIKPENVYNINERYLNQTPFLKCKLDENIIKNICLRSVLIKSIYEIWAGLSLILFSFLFSLSYSLLRG